MISSVMLVLTCVLLYFSSLLFLYFWLPVLLTPPLSALDWTSHQSLSSPSRGTLIIIILLIIMMLDRDSDDDHDFWALHETPNSLFRSTHLIILIALKQILVTRFLWTKKTDFKESWFSTWSWTKARGMSWLNSELKCPQNSFALIWILPPVRIIKHHSPKDKQNSKKATKGIVRFPPPTHRRWLLKSGGEPVYERQS